ncbi:MAG TPA: serine hydrolase domain-containing protein [Gemmatimonadales bacterium]|nr:serine hydrolase domain-containing protein [Gemmatimonadales bacterium]
MHRSVIVAVALLFPLALAAQEPDLPSRIDQIFARYDRNTPGCTVGLAKDGRTLYTQGYGSANLEYGVPLTATSVMESGSVAKQFTAAALVLLQQDGKLSLDDDIRKYLPEVPDFGRTITIRHLLTHTSGLRDQWGLLGIEGRGPGTQVHSPMTALDLVAHQKMLNFPPGTAYLYSNTGYALAALIIERVSGKSLQEFSQERLFRPLGMRHTQWRDDFTRVVPRRATAYSPSDSGYHTDMPFTNMVGNGGLLSTMDDLLRWNENLDHPIVGGQAFTEIMQTPMRLTNGRTIDYALGLGVGEYDGVREISHTGSTAGYRTFLARYPDQRVSIAVWCNNSGANAGALGHQVADLVLTKPARTANAASARAVRLSLAALSQWAGVYRDPTTGRAVTLTVADTALISGDDDVYVPTAASRFSTRSGEAAFTGAPGRRTFTLARADGDTVRFEEVPPPASPLPTGDYVGRYVSDELDVVLTVVAVDGKVEIRRRPNDRIAMRPTYRDAFETDEIGSVRFTRNAKGKVTGLAIFAGRVRDVRFRRVP